MDEFPIHWFSPLPHSGSRKQAGTLIADLSDDLSCKTIVIYCEYIISSSPSFFDELVKQTLVERKALALEIVGANERCIQHAVRSAANRGVSDRLHIST